MRARIGLLLRRGYGEMNRNTKGQRWEADGAVGISVLYNETVLNFEELGHS